MSGVQDKLRNYILSLNQQGLLRSRQVSDLDDPPGVRFDSNDYLSLRKDKRLAAAYQHGFGLYPTGSGASMLLSGYHATHQAVEQAFASLLKVDECVLFSSGYAANLAVTALLGVIKTHCILDKRMHASVYDGLALSQVPYSRYLHNNRDDLSLKLDTVFEEAVVMTEGIFSMSGQIAPLKALSSLCLEKKAVLLVDEAHSFGVLGEQGKGAVDYQGLTQKEVPLRVIPLSKAFAAQGAIVAGETAWIQALLQAGRSLTYTTASSPALAYGLLKTLDIFVNSEDRRLKLRQLIAYFREQIQESALTWTDSTTPIQQLQLGCPHLALHYARELKKAGIYCSAIRSPTVSKKSTGLCILLNYEHGFEQIQSLFDKIQALHASTS